jgi:asparagine synthase (glutamine-hydrolysing)
MCGIFGYYDQNKKTIAPDVLRNMGRVIKHRGPDDEGIFAKEGVAIGNQRLSIIDIQGGHQPFISDSGDIAVVQNGEIFNHIELAAELRKNGVICKTDCDTEVLLRLYETEGISFVNKLNGMFAISIYDARTDTIFLVRDRLGVKPLYIYEQQGKYIFGSEIKSILQADVPVKLDKRSLYYYLAFNFVPPPYTIYNNIEHVMPGTYLEITRDRVQVHQWWDLSEQNVEQKSEVEWTEQFLALLDDSVRLRLRSDVPFGAFLSGGLDSSTVVALMSRHMKQPVKTFSIGFSDPKYDESIYAKQVSDLFNTEHTCEIVDPNMLQLWPFVTYHCDQPHGDVSFMPTFKVAQLAAEHVKMVLTGDGGDELFAGYDKYLNFFDRSSVFTGSQQSFEKSYMDASSLFSESIIKTQLLSESFLSEISGITASDITDDIFVKCRHMDRINQALYFDTMLLLPGNNLVKPDRMGMAVSLEARTPFLDYRMAELAFRIPGSLKLKDGTTKYIYKKASEQLLGKELVHRKKQMFTVPIGDWFRKELAQFTESKLLNGQLVSTGIVRKEEVYRMLKDHQSSKGNYTREIRALISVEYWFEQFNPA